MDKYTIFLLNDQDTLYSIHFSPEEGVSSPEIVLEGYALTHHVGDLLVFEKGDDIQIFDASIGVWLAVFPDMLDIEFEWGDKIRAQVTPLSGPRDFYFIPLMDAVIFSMTGETDNFLNLYWMDDTETIHQLSDAQSLAPPDTIILSASAEVIAWRPEHEAQFLYRERVRLADGTDLNQLFLYALTTQTRTDAPYFGKDPVWSPDGMQLVGGRFDAEGTPPLYMLTLENLADETSKVLGAGCNPQFSPDGLFVAFDEHLTSQDLNYTDCFASGEVRIYDLSTDKSFSITAEIEGYTQLVGWQQN